LGDPTVDEEGGTVSPVDFDPPARGVGGSERRVARLMK
jgi:hypothetical protein